MLVFQDCGLRIPRYHRMGKLKEKSADENDSFCQPDELSNRKYRKKLIYF